MLSLIFLLLTAVHSNNVSSFENHLPENQWFIQRINSKAFDNNYSITVSFQDAMKAPRAIVGYHSIQIVNQTDIWFVIKLESVTNTSLTFSINTSQNSQSSLIKVIVLAFKVPYIDTYDFLAYQPPATSIMSQTVKINSFVSAVCYSDVAETQQGTMVYISIFRGFVGYKVTAIYAMDDGSNQGNMLIEGYTQNWISQIHYSFIILCENSYKFKPYYTHQFTSMITSKLAYGNQTLTENKGTSGMQDWSNPLTSIVSFEVLLNTYIVWMDFVSLDLNHSSSQLSYSYTGQGYSQLNIFSLISKQCSGDMELNLTDTSWCFCNQSKYFYYNNSYSTTACQLKCPISTFPNDKHCQNCNTTYNINCLTCNSSDCTSCRTNFKLQSPNCLCTNDRYFNGTDCVLCSTAFDSNCAKCSISECTQCAKGYSLHTNGSCIQCGEMYERSCNECNESECLSCSSGYSLQNGGCRCSTSVVNNSCVTCTFAYANGSTCELLSSLNHLQFLKVVYFEMVFNHPLPQITGLETLPNNIMIQQGKEPLEFTYWPYQWFSLTLTNNNTTLFVQVIDKNSLSWNENPLKQDPTPLTVSIGQNFDGLNIIEWLSMIIKIVFALQILLSFGIFNFGFESWILMSQFIFLQKNMNNCVGAALNIVNLSNFGRVLPPRNLPSLQLDFMSAPLKLKVYSLNHDIFFLTSEITLLFLASIALVFGTKRYLTRKKDHMKSFAYSNFMVYHKEYILANWHSLLPFFMFSSLVEIRLLSDRNWDVSGLEMIHAIIVVGFLVGLLVGITVGVAMLPPVRKKYAIFYDKMVANNCFTLIRHFLNLLRLVMFPALILLAQQFFFLQETLLLLNGLYLLIVIMSVRTYLSKMFWLFQLIKTVSLLVFQLCIILIQASKITVLLPLDYIGYLLLLFVGFIEVFQFIIKLLRHIAVNKMLISDQSYSSVVPEEHQYSQNNSNQ